MVTFMSIGDIYVDRPDPASILGDTVEVLGRADVLVANQEVPITDRGRDWPGVVEAGMACIRGRLESVHALTAAGVTAVTLANNHGIDFGPEGLLHTIEHLADHGIAAFGAGVDDLAAHAPLVVERGGTRIANLGYTTVFPPGALAGPDRPGLAGIRVRTAYEQSVAVPYQPGTPAITVTFPHEGDVARMEADIAAARSVADLVVVQLHWGVAGHNRALGHMVELGRTAVDAGADLVVGNHPHVLMGVEVHRGVPIYYNLNHFALDLSAPPSWPGRCDAVILRADIEDGRFVRHAVVPVALDPVSHDLSVTRGPARDRARDLLLGLSAGAGTRFEVDGDELVVLGPEVEASPPVRSRSVQFDPPSHLAEALADTEKIVAAQAAR
jgi:poly-gamma-glutamate synthesis protein (capsule biosynthesis protein)